MRKFFYIILAVCLYSCEKSEIAPEQEIDDNKLVKINLINPRIPSTLSDEGSEGIINKENMPVNSTIRLFIYKYVEGGYPNPDKRNLVTDVNLRVRDISEGGGSTILCRVNEKGEPIGDITDTDIHLPASVYDFYAISPAIKLDTTKLSPQTMIDHGDARTIRTTTAKRFNIGYHSPEIPNVTPGFFNLQPDVFTLLTSRLTFELEKGVKVTELRVDPRGMQVSNLTPGAYYANFVLGNSELTPMQIEGSTPGKIVIPYDESVNTHPSDPDRHFFEAQIIPHKTGEKSDVELRFHLLVNGGNYKAYTTVLKDQHFARGVSYNYKVKVNVGGIFVTGWNSHYDWETSIKN